MREPDELCRSRRCFQQEPIQSIGELMSLFHHKGHNGHKGGHTRRSDIPGGWAYDKPCVSKINLQAAFSCDTIRRMLVAWIAASIGVVGVVAYRAQIGRAHV